MATIKVADLYVRVSTDEQADKGYSQRNQEEVLRRYCDINNIRVRHVVYEDHSAKSFNRPEWTKLLANLKTRKDQSDLVLFTKWDRFSRNAGDAYQMISILRKLGVEPQSVEQPLDLSIPENKMMLAIYLSAPEVENDRRALNVFFGMRRAKKEGRWMGTAPIGYKNRTTESGAKYIAPDEKNAPIMTWIFYEIAAARHNVEQIWKMARQKGLQCSKNNFWVAIRNPMYCGKIFIPKYKDEESQTVKGQHAPLISEALYYEVQEVLDGRKKNQRLKIRVDDKLALRGFIVCHRCGRTLTGSASKGRSGYYHYYHCSSVCGSRFKAEETDELLNRKIVKYFPKPGMIELYKLILTNTFKTQIGHKTTERNRIIQQINGLETRLKKARDKYADDEMLADDYYALKKDIEKSIRDWEKELAGLCSQDKGIDKLINEAMESALQIDHLYHEGTIEEKRNVIGSIFPEKWVFDGLQHRTTRINSIAELIFSVDAGLGEIKNGTSTDLAYLSHQVIPLGLEPRAPSLKVMCSTN
jgi:site-specific DNA recombinase